MTPDMSAEQISSVLLTDKVVGGRLQEMPAELEKLSKFIAITEERTFSTLRGEITTIFNIGEVEAKEQQQIDELREWVEAKGG